METAEPSSYSAADHLINPDFAHLASRGELESNAWLTAAISDELWMGSAKTLG